MQQHLWPEGAVLLYEAVHGSQAFGLDRPGSDLDLKGIFVGPRHWYGGFAEVPEQIELDKDHTRYEIRKFFRLAAEANPTALELLFVASDRRRTVTPAGERLLGERRRFLSRRVADSFGNYAISQLKRIKTHRRWLLEPPRVEPTRSAFGLPEQALISNDQLGAAEALMHRGDLDPATLSPNFLRVLQQERNYRNARREWQQYHSWLRERNPARAQLEAHFGFDTKHALHLVRLLRMSLEILRTGEVTVTRPDREELLAIRDGAWPFDRLLSYAESMHGQIEEARVASPLPAQPDWDALNRLCADIVGEVAYGHPA